MLISNPVSDFYLLVVVLVRNIDCQYIDNIDIERPLWTILIDIDIGIDIKKDILKNIYVEKDIFENTNIYKDILENINIDL